MMNNNNNILRSTKVLGSIWIVRIDIVWFSKIFLVYFSAYFFTPFLRSLILSHGFKEGISHSIRIDGFTNDFKRNISDSCQVEHTDHQGGPPGVETHFRSAEYPHFESVVLDVDVLQLVINKVKLILTQVS